MNEADAVYLLKGAHGFKVAHLLQKLGTFYSEKGLDIEYFHDPLFENTIEAIFIKGPVPTLIVQATNLDINPVALGDRDHVISLHDCVDEEKLDYLSDLAQGRVLSGWTRSLVGEPERTAPIIIVEYGVESCYDQTLQRINRGHDFETACRAIEMTAKRGLDVGVHFILGLPGETRQMMLDSCSLINALPIRSVKFHQLQIVKGTRMEQEYSECPEDFERFALDEYLDFFVDMLERLRPTLSIERFVGEVPPRFVNETPWGLIRNVELIRLLEQRLESRQTWQGRLYIKWGT